MTSGVPESSVHPRSREEWRAWLERNHERDEGVWLISHTKASGLPRVGYDEAVEEALCFGWVDSKGNKLDADRSMLWFSPRRKGSGWSRSNRARVERLIAEGKMHPVGQAKIDAAMADGSWLRLESYEALEVPEDLTAAFGRYPTSAERFTAFPPSARRAILEWIGVAKRPETRAKRVEETARLAAEGIRANEWRPSKER